MSIETTNTPLRLMTDHVASVKRKGALSLSSAREGGLLVPVALDKPVITGFPGLWCPTDGHCDRFALQSTCGDCLDHPPGRPGGVVTQNPGAEASRPGFKPCFVYAVAASPPARGLPPVSVSSFSYLGKYKNTTTYLVVLL